MGRLIATIGPARSGKTTWSSDFHKTATALKRTCAVLEDDEIRLALYGQRYCRLGEPSVFAHKYVALRALLTRHDYVISVDTHTTERSIRHLLEIDPQTEFKIFTTSVDVCEERARATNQDDLVDHGVIRRHWNNMLDFAQLNPAGNWHEVPERVTESILLQIEHLRRSYNAN